MGTGCERITIYSLNSRQREVSAPILLQRERTILRIFALGCICHLLLIACETLAQKPSADMQEVVAAIDDEPIYESDVIRLLNKVTRGHDVNPAASPLLQAQILEEIIDRRLVLAYARRMGTTPTPEEVDLELDKLKSKLASQQQSLADYL